MSLNKSHSDETEEKESIIEDDCERSILKQIENKASQSQIIKKDETKDKQAFNNNENNKTINNNNEENDDDTYEKFAIKSRNNSNVENTKRRMSLIPSQMVKVNESKIQKLRMSHNFVNERDNQSIVEMSNTKNNKFDDNIDYSFKKNSQLIDEKSESKGSKDTISNVGLNNGEKRRKGYNKSYSEISSSVNREQRKSTMMKKNLCHTLLKNTKNNALLLIITLILILIVSSLLELISFKKINMVTSFMKNLQIVVTFPSVFINISTKVRLLTIYGHLNKKDVYDYYHDQIRTYIDNDLTNTIIPYIEKYKTVKKYNPFFPFIIKNEKDKSYKLVVRSVEDSNKMSFEYLSIYDLSKRILNWADYITDLEYEVWNDSNNDNLITDTSLKIHDYHARFFTDNLKYSLNDIYNSFVEDNINEIKNNYNYENLAIIYIGLVGANVVLLIILYKYGISYSLDSVKHLQLKVFNIYKYLPEEYINETITKYNHSIDKIASTINFEMSDSYLNIYDTSCKKNNILFRQKFITRMILYAYSIICICSVLPLVVSFLTLKINLTL
ncbi:hypothetical protein BCR36DRAFT_146918 [Piromyces finnis]|uniref:Uncharacterized protein n=1 Tax=Piromyces finnis TaxID=1754191 RepID=A0A1Y1UXU0_9FUNG|nr:hypothetical protein BCR36DRAFT_146918 [Piromyces finnis]|eukprot:ORX43141.1 hypothetical protein BCR36DRAFT_146918 [Piromyces finnis]